ncbi:MAG: hypothetical protein ACN4GK_02730 [Acidimicrobiia bacterium]
MANSAFLGFAGTPNANTEVDFTHSGDGSTVATYETILAVLHPVEGHRFRQRLPQRRPVESAHMLV